MQHTLDTHSRPDTRPYNAPTLQTPTHIKYGALLVCAYVVHLSHNALVEHYVKRCCDVFNVQVTGGGVATWCRNCVS